MNLFASSSIENPCGNVSSYMVHSNHSITTDCQVLFLTLAVRRQNYSTEVLLLSHKYS